jgi:hypothetical protein
MIRNTLSKIYQHIIFVFVNNEIYNNEIYNNEYFFDVIIKQIDQY